MRGVRFGFTVVGVCALLVLTTTHATAAGVWGEARPAVFGAGVQSASPDEEFQSVSCGSVGNCVAVGSFQNASGGYEAFSMSLVAGVWGEARPAVFGAGVQNASPRADFKSVSCVSAGDCVAVGTFRNASGGFEAFSMSLVAGVWGEARPAVFGAGLQHANPNAYFNSVSCGSAGDCVAVGSFINAAGGNEAFSMSLVAGVWGEARPAVFGSGAQFAIPDARFESVSCGSVGNCVAVGSFRNATGDFKAFSMSLVAGVWGEAQPAVFGAGLQSALPNSYAHSVSCASAGNCVAAGSFVNAAGGIEAFSMSLVAGVWGEAQPAEFGAGVQNPLPSTFVRSVSCASAGNCVAAGYFQNAAGGYEAFSMSLVAGVWGEARPAVFGVGLQNAIPDARFESVSCGSAGNCVAVGNFSNVAGATEAFSMSFVAGVWGEARPAVFGVGVQNANPYDYFNSVSCGSAGNCVAVGSFINVAGGTEAFTMTAVDDTPFPSTTTVAPSTTTVAPSSIAPVLPATGSESDRTLVAALCALVVGLAVMVRRRCLID